MIEPSIEYEEGDIYYGATTQPLHKRFFGHKSNYKRNIHKYQSSLLFNKYGVENIKVILIKQFPCENKKELEAEEAKYIRENKCVNKNIPLRTHKEWRDNNREKIKEYNEVNKEKAKEKYELNKDEIKERQKKYRETNKEKIKEKGKKYYETNKDKICEKTKKYYEENKEKLKVNYNENKENIKEIRSEYYENNKEKIKEKRKETFKCICGCVCLVICKNRHLKTTKHLSLLTLLK
tara:strand:+ start:627 stop:1334 length:708 start_codon:yes stop_codon:yes gene_type:complete